MAVLLDSGFLFASLNTSEAEHQSTIRVLRGVLICISSLCNLSVLCVSVVSWAEKLVHRSGRRGYAEKRTFCSRNPFDILSIGLLVQLNPDRHQVNK